MKQKQNKNNYAHCDFPGYSKCGKNLYSIPTPSNYKGIIRIETLIYENQNLPH
jgi:hypothetical protein